MTPQDQQSPIQSVGGDTVREQDKIQLVLAYLGCLSLIPFLTVKDSEYVKWHAKQGLTLCVVGFIAIIAITIPLSFIGIGACLGPILSLGLLVVSIMAILKALKGERWRLPVIADLSEKF
ncbi:MAG: DUF4870 domain-containing protein [Myxococcales bacterium]|nr:DUF4870 domain-containing protein [Myxococcales bacterium]